MTCLTAAPRAEGAVVEHAIAPKTTDPAITIALDDHYAYANTSVPPEADLFVFMPGATRKPVETKVILQQAVANGFRAIGLTYPNDRTLFSLCPATNTDPDCHGKIRRETVTGEDASDLVTVSRADSIENRLIKLLQHLHATYPSEGWNAWIVAGEPNWRRIRLCGHSNGGDFAAYVGKTRELAGAICFSSPSDWDLRLDQAPAWVAGPQATPASRYFGFTHIQDGVAPWANVQRIWSTLGMASFGTPTLVDGAVPPFSGAHQLTTNLPLLPENGSRHAMTILDAYTPREADGTPTFAPAWKAAAFWKSTPPNTWLLPSAARAAGAGGAFYTTDVILANTGTTDAAFTFKFLRHDADGRTGVEKTFTLSPGKSVTYADVLGSVFDLSSDYGAVLLTTSSTTLSFAAQTSTPSPSGGTFGQSVPAFPDGEMVRPGSTKSILAIREDPGVRTNLILANASEMPTDVDVTLLADTGVTLGTRRFTLPPLGMTQVGRVVRELGVSASVSGGRLILSTQTDGGSFAAYASAIDNTTNDPRTLLPR